MAVRGSAPILEENKKQQNPGSSFVKQVAEKRIGVHCVAGLGRAPFLVALAIVYKGCKPQNAIKLIRS